LAHGDFIWCDLATGDPAGASAFYTEIFGWRETGAIEIDTGPYRVFSCAGGEVAGVYEMPGKFQSMGLPNFWMSYIEVDDVSQAVETANRHGGKVELGPIDFFDGASVALIRDPLGAGFTVYQGPPLGTAVQTPKPGQRVWHSLHTSDAKAVMPFYESLFGWAREETATGSVFARDSAGGKIAEIQELSEEVRGSFVYWVIHFGVASVEETERRAESKGGRIASRFEDQTVGRTSLLYGPDNAGFCISQVTDVSNRPVESDRKPGTSPPISVPWKSCLALAALWGATLLEQEWVWGVMFLLWAIPALKYGRVFLLEDVRRDRYPVVFWLIVFTWIGLSLLLIVYDLAPEWLESTYSS